MRRQLKGRLTSLVCKAFHFNGRIKLESCHLKQQYPKMSHLQLQVNKLEGKPFKFMMIGYFQKNQG